MEYWIQEKYVAGMQHKLKWMQCVAYKYHAQDITDKYN